MKKATILLAILVLLFAVGCKSEVSDGITKSDYLVLLYLSGDANNGDNFFPTLQQAEDALYEIRNDDGSAKDGYATVSVAALWDGPNSINEYVHSDSRTRLLELGPGYHDFDDNTNTGLYERKVDWSLSSKTKDLSSTVDWIFKNGRQEVNMGSQKTLSQFLNWAGNRYKADHVILLFGDHGSGPTPKEESSKGLIFDGDVNGEIEEGSFLTTIKIRNAIADSSLNGKIDIIIEDLCLQSSIDEAYGLQGFAKYLIASENVTYGNSLGSYKLIKDMRKNTPILSIAKNQVDYFKNKWSKNETETVSTFALMDLTDSESYSSIKEKVSALAESIQALGNTTYTDIVNNFRSTATDYGVAFEASYVYLRDLGILVKKLGEQYPSLQSKTDAILNSLKKVIIRSFVCGKSNLQNATFKYDIADNPEYGLTIAINKRIENYPSYSTWTLFGKDSKWSELIVDYSSED